MAAARRAIQQRSSRDSLEAGFGRPLGAAFRSIFGGRGETGATPAFREWAFGLVGAAEPKPFRWLAAFGLVGWDDPRAEAVFASRNAPEPARSMHKSITEARAAPIALNPGFALFAPKKEASTAPLPDAASRERHLDALGFTPTEGSLGNGSDDADVVAALRARGRALVFDSETGHSPVEHDELLYWIASLVPSLQDVEFEQACSELENDRYSYALHAYADGLRRRAIAIDSHDFYDVDSCVGFINTLLWLRRAPDRVVVLDPPDQNVRLVAGPRESLLQLRREGVLDFGHAEREGDVARVEPPKRHPTERGPFLRLEAAFARAKAGDFDARDVLLSGLRHTDPMARSRAAWMLAQIGASWAVEPLSKLTRDRQTTVRNEAILGLAQTHSVAAVPSLLRALGDKDPERREDARVALVSLLGRGIADALDEMEEDRPQEIADASAWWEANAHRFDSETAYDDGLPLSLGRWIDQMGTSTEGVADVIADRLTTWTGFEPEVADPKDRVERWRAWWRDNQDRFPPGRRSFWGHPV